MKAALAGLGALICGAAVALATWIVGLQLAPPTCPRCEGPGPCSLVACVFDVRGHMAVAGLFGVVAVALALLAIRRWAR